MREVKVGQVYREPQRGEVFRVTKIDKPWVYFHLLDIGRGAWGQVDSKWHYITCKDLKAHYILDESSTVKEILSKYECKD
jgi:hypothetical protein